MDAPEHRETERKYDVPDGAEVPDLTQVPGVAEVAPPLELQQVATYYDTPDLRLLAARVTLRRRIGGTDDGWHLKLPGDGDTRHEVRLPADGRTDPPAELLDRVRVHLRAAHVEPCVVLDTRRTVVRLLDPGGAVLADFCDDRVAARVEGRAAPVDRWREWELEVVGGPESLLDAAEPVLNAAGAHRAAVASKAARVLGEALAAQPSWRARMQLGDDPTTGDLLCAYLAEHLTELQREDVALRGGGHEGVHRLRIAARRLRSALATYAPALEPGTGETLREELRWLGAALSEARDAQVLQTRLEELVGGQPVELVLGPVPQRIGDELRTAYRTARSHAVAQLETARYFRLHDDLEALLHDPPLTELGRAPAREAVADLVARDLRRLRRRDRARRRAATEEDREVALHDVRKAAKRLRYAAESVRPVYGKRAGKLAARAKAVQQLLGEHQDTVVARRFLRDVGVRAHLAGENGFTFGRLHALEQAHGAALAERYPAVRRKLPRRPLREWLEQTP